MLFYILVIAAAVWVVVVWWRPTTTSRLPKWMRSGVWPYSILASAVVALTLLWGFRIVGRTLDSGWAENLTAEGVGFLADIVLFGVILAILDQRREARMKKAELLRRRAHSRMLRRLERERMIRDYQNQLTDFIPWESQEGGFERSGLSGG